jgi:hypothetical protein
MVSVARLLEYIVCIEASSSPVIVFFVGSNPRVMPHKTKIGPVIESKLTPLRPTVSPTPVYSTDTELIT